MIDPDELERRPAVVKPADLKALSVAELEAYVQSLKSEIEAAEQVIAQKRAHLGAAAGLFKTGAS